MPQTHNPGGQAEVDVADLWIDLKGVRTKVFLFTLRLSFSGNAIHRAFASQSQVPRMRTLHIGLRVSDLELSLAFYTAIGYDVVGSVPETPIGHLSMLKLPDDEFVSVELVHDGKPVDRGTDVSHLVVKVESMAGTLDVLAGHGVEPVGPGQDSDHGLKTAFIADPDGRRIELVQWPAGHADGITAADWAEERE